MPLVTEVMVDDAELELDTADKDKEKIGQLES